MQQIDDGLFNEWVTVSVLEEANIDTHLPPQRNQAAQWPCQKRTRAAQPSENSESCRDEPILVGESRHWQCHHTSHSWISPDTGP